MVEAKASVGLLKTKPIMAETNPMHPKKFTKPLTSFLFIFIPLAEYKFLWMILDIYLNPEIHPFRI